MTTLILRNGSTQNLETISGEVGELFVDTTKNVVVCSTEIGGNPVGTESYAQDNLLPPINGNNGKYLKLEGSSVSWSKGNIVRPGTVLKTLVELQEPEYIKFDGIPKNKIDYVEISSLLKDEYGLVNFLVQNTNSNFLNANSHPADLYYSGNESKTSSNLELKYPLPSSNYNNMIYDGSHYVRILGHYDPNYSSKDRGMLDEDGNYVLPAYYLNLEYVFYPVHQPPYPPSGEDFKVQYSEDGINWTTVIVEKFSNSATRCASLATDGEGSLYMVAQKIPDLREIRLNSEPSAINDIVVKSTDHGVTWDVILEKEFNDGRIISCNPVTKELYVFPGRSVDPETSEILSTQPEVSSILHSIDYGVSWNTKPITKIRDKQNLPTPRFNNPSYTQDGNLVCVFAKNDSIPHGILYESDGSLLYSDYLTLRDREYNDLQFEPCITYNEEDGYFYSAQTKPISGLSSITVLDGGSGVTNANNQTTFTVDLTLRGYEEAYNYPPKIRITVLNGTVTNIAVLDEGFGPFVPVQWLDFVSSASGTLSLKYNFDSSGERGIVVVKKHNSSNSLLDGIYDQKAYKYDISSGALTSSIYTETISDQYSAYNYFDKTEEVKAMGAGAQVYTITSNTSNPSSIVQKNQGSTISWLIQNPDLSNENSDADSFGAALAARNRYYLIGAPTAQSSGNLRGGKVYVGDSNTHSIVASITPPAGDVGNFGYSVAISDTSGVIGNPKLNKVYVYSNVINQTLSYTLTGGPGFGTAVAITNNRVAVSESSTNKVYTYDISTGELIDTLINPFPSFEKGNGNFGYALATEVTITGTPETGPIITEFLIVGAVPPSQQITETAWENYAVFDNKKLFNPIEDELGLDKSDYRYGLGIVKIHMSPIFGTMIFTKNKILYNTDPENNPNAWDIVVGLDETKVYNFSTCINVEDGVIVSSENEVIKLYKSTTEFALKNIPPYEESGVTINTYLKV